MLRALLNFFSKSKDNNDLSNVPAETEKATPAPAPAAPDPTPAPAIKTSKKTNRTPRTLTKKSPATTKTAVKKKVRK